MMRYFAALCLLLVCPPAAFSENSDSTGIARTAPASAGRSSETGACSRDLRDDPNAGVVISEAVFNGTAVSSSVITRIKDKIVGVCFDDHSDEVGELIKAAFADEGFARADVQNVSLKASDTLAVPKPVRVEADVVEGQRFRFGPITFVGNRAFSAAKLRTVFPVKKGDLFQRSKIVSGFTRIRNLYAHKGYQDLFFIPDDTISTGTVDLMITVHEGTQYRMGELRVYAKKEISDQLGVQWKLNEGAVFDSTYPQTFVDESHSLPAGFDRENIVLVKNCPDATIAVLLIVDQTDPGLQNTPKEVRCKKPD